MSKCYVVIETQQTIISECNKLAKTLCKTRPYLGRKMVNWELCKKLNFDYTNEWFMHIQESVLENETQKILWDYGIQVDLLMLIRRPYPLIVN